MVRIVQLLSLSGCYSTLMALANWITHWDLVHACHASDTRKRKPTSWKLKVKKKKHLLAMNVVVFSFQTKVENKWDIVTALSSVERIKRQCGFPTTGYQMIWSFHLTNLPCELHHEYATFKVSPYHVTLLVWNTQGRLFAFPICILKSEQWRPCRASALTMLAMPIGWAIFWIIGCIKETSIEKRWRWGHSIWSISLFSGDGRK